MPKRKTVKTVLLRLSPALYEKLLQRRSLESRSEGKPVSVAKVALDAVEKGFQ